MATKVSIELGSNVKELVEDRDHLLLESEVLKPGEAKGEQVEDLNAAYEIALDLVRPSASALGRRSLAKAERSDFRLQSERPPSACSSNNHKDSIHVNVAQVRSPCDHVDAQTGHCPSEVEGLPAKPQNARSMNRNGFGKGPARSDYPQGQRSGTLFASPLVDDGMFLGGNSASRALRNHRTHQSIREAPPTHPEALLVA
jgi:hypothetical protein